jgi:peptidoglycan/LPS O-acetylase OafA/YrhL
MSVRETFRPDIEGLRGVAILLVVAYHAHVPGIGGGYVGVDVFFVLSGYLITRLLVDEIESRGSLDFVRFYARRARRLVPAAALVLVATTLAGSLIYSPIEHRRLANGAVATALYLSNFWFARLSLEYLAPEADTNPLVHTWSLAVEEQFYLVWPVLVLLALLGVRRAAASRARLVLIMTVVALASFGASVWLTRLAQPWAFFGSPTRAWEFAVGGLGCLVPAVVLRARPRLAAGLGWIGLLSMLLAGVVYTRATSFPGVAAALPVLGTAMVLVTSAHAARGGPAALLGTPPLQTIGRLSYSWYLWHWPLLVMADPLVGQLGGIAQVGLMVVALGMAAVTYRTLEHPVRTNPYLVRRPWTSLAVTAGIVLLAVSVSFSLRQTSARWAAAPGQRELARAHAEIPPVYSNGCHLDQFDVESGPCTFGVPASNVAIVLFGDSHAAQWFPALEAIALEKRWRLVSMTKSACPAAWVEPFNESLGRKYAECTRWRATAARRIHDLHPAVVLLASASGYIRGSEPVTDQRFIAVGEWQTGLAHTLDALDEPGRQVVLVGEVPNPGFDSPYCLARAAWNPWGSAASCTFPRSGKHLLARRIDREVAAGRPNVSVLDLSDAICHVDRCDPIQDHKVIYRDSHHLTVQFSESLAPAIAQHLERLLPATGG